MKLSIASIALFAVATNATSLRKPSGNGRTSSMLQSKVVLKGLSAEPSEADKDFIGKALVASYNNVHWEVGHFLTGEHTTEFVGDNCMYW